MDRRGHTRDSGFAIRGWNRPAARGGRQSQRCEESVSRRPGPWYCGREDIDLRHVRPAAGAVAASRNQIDEADLVNLAQVGPLHDVAGGDDAVDIELEPVHVSDVEL